MTTKNEYIQSIAEEMKVWSHQIDLMVEKAENHSDELELKCNEELQAIQDKYSELAQKMKELEEAGDDVWQSIKVTVDQIIEEMKSCLNNVVSEIFKT